MRAQRNRQQAKQVRSHAHPGAGQSCKCGTHRGCRASNAPLCAPRRCVFLVVPWQRMRTRRVVRRCAGPFLLAGSTLLCACLLTGWVTPFAAATAVQEPVVKEPASSSVAAGAAGSSKPRSSFSFADVTDVDASNSASASAGPSTSGAPESDGGPAGGAGVVQGRAHHAPGQGRRAGTKRVGHTHCLCSSRTTSFAD